MPNLGSIASKQGSYSDSAVLRRASSLDYKGSTTGSFVGGGSNSYVAAGARDSELAAATRDIDTNLLGDNQAGGLPMHGRYRLGFFAQYFTVGVIYGGLPATTYGFLLGYLNTPSYVYSTCTTLLALPWSFKFILGAINDCVPIMGYRRKPYMVIGWTICAAMLVVLYLYPLPEPYYCIDPTTLEYDLEIAPCNNGASQAGTIPTILMIFASFGYVIADVAADGLTVQYARAEPESRRGYTQSTAYLTRALGQVFASLVVGFGMNGYEYLGSFEYNLTFNEVCLIFAVLAGAMVPISIFCVDEKRLLERHTFSEYAGATWQLMRSKAFFYVVLWQFFNPAIQYVSTTAGSQVQRYWAGVETLQAQLASVVAYLLFSLALYIVRERFLHISWRLMLILTTASLNVIDVPFSMLTVFDVVRNQYFYLGETLLTELPNAAFFVVSCFVIVEMATADNEGLIYGLLTTVSNCGKSLPNAFSNQLYGLFYPALSDSSNYIAARGGDQQCFRVVVACSIAVGYAFSFASLITMPLLPNQKADAQHRLATWPHHTGYAVATCTLIFLGLGYSLTVNFLALTPLACLEFVGGQGCGTDESGSGSGEVGMAQPC